MPAPGFVPRGTQLQRGDDTLPNPNYTLVAHVTDINFSGSSSETDNVTNMDSPSAYEELLPTVLKAGDVDFECIFVPGDATQDIVDTDFDNQRTGPWKVQLPASQGDKFVTFNAFVANTGYQLPVTKAGKRKLKLTITGPIARSW